MKTINRLNGYEEKRQKEKVIFLQKQNLYDKIDDMITTGIISSEEAIKIMDIVEKR